eukprot:2760255-Pyramimonas_sp.AAC.1
MDIIFVSSDPHRNLRCLVPTARAPTGRMCAVPGGVGQRGRRARSQVDVVRILTTPTPLTKTKPDPKRFLRYTKTCSEIVSTS